MDVQQIKEQIVEAVMIILRGRAISRSFHGNISARTGSNLVLTTRSHLDEHFTTESLSVIDPNSEESRATLHPSTQEIVDMHDVVYSVRPDVNVVIHTHAPHTTAFAISSKPIPSAYEAMVRHDILEGVPLAKYGPRGSPESIRNIQDVIRPDTRAVLLENHGVLVFGKDVRETARLAVTIEEAAEMIIMAESLGEVHPIPPEMVRSTIDRKKQFSYSD